jgi:hypothetical protein
MRFRDEKPGDMDRAREVVTAWRAEHPQGTAEQMLADVGGQFHPEWGIVLRGTLFAVDRKAPTQVTGTRA